MTLNKHVRLLQNKWQNRAGWPQRLEWIEMDGIRGWTGQRIEFNSPITAICGENGAGKSTILQAASIVYYQTKTQKDTFAGDLYPQTPWDNLVGARIRYSVRQGNNPARIGEFRRVSDRWVGYKDRPFRDVISKDLGRVQPLISRLGYFNVAKTARKETASADMDGEVVARLSEIMGRQYTRSRNATTEADETRPVPVIARGGLEFSGFHQGAGELTVQDLLGVKPIRNSLLLIDEIETSLHPRAQRRLIHDLAAVAREHEIQIILTTHSPYILEELPTEARCYIALTSEGKEILTGVSPQFAMSKMDDEFHPEGDIYVEDEVSKVMLTEIINQHARDISGKVDIIPYGAAGVGNALGQMLMGGRFKRRPTTVFLDGDQSAAPGCVLLPGGDAPERVVLEQLAKKNWGLLGMRINRTPTEVSDAFQRAMTSSQHKDWLPSAATALQIGTDALWAAVCAFWSVECVTTAIAAPVVTPIRESLLPKVG